MHLVDPSKNRTFPLLLAILFILLVLHFALNTWAALRQGNWSLLSEAKFWIGYPLWLEEFVEASRPGSVRHILGLVLLVALAIFAILWTVDFLTGRSLPLYWTP